MRVKRAAGHQSGNLAVRRRGDIYRFARRNVLRGDHTSEHADRLVAGERMRLRHRVMKIRNRGVRIYDAAPNQRRDLRAGSALHAVVGLMANNAGNLCDGLVARNGVIGDLLFDLMDWIRQVGRRMNLRGLVPALSRISL